MDAKKQIEQFVEDNIVNTCDYYLLDILWIFRYSLPSKSAYTGKDTSLIFKKWFKKVCTVNLKTRWSLGEIKISEKIKVFVDFLESIKPFLSYETFDEDVELFREILSDKTSKILIQNINNKKFNNTSDGLIDKNVLSFVLNYIPLRIKDSIEEAEEWKKQNPKYDEKYYFLPDFRVVTSDRFDEINYFEIDAKKWAYIFNFLFDTELKIYSVGRHCEGTTRVFPVQVKKYEEIYLHEFGDKLVNIGVGYWRLYVSSKGKISVDLIIPNFIYEQVRGRKQEIKNFEERIHEFKGHEKNKALENAWGLGGSEETEPKSEVYESEIEDSIVSNLELLGDNLKLIGRQYSTATGPIDVLCRDKNGHPIVIELKRDKDPDKVVSEISRYMAWVEENLENGASVRGIVVVREEDEKIKYAVKASRFPIEVKVFGPVPPVEENIKYCTKCGKPNKKSASYCSKCGQESWL